MYLLWLVSIAVIFLCSGSHYPHNNPRMLGVRPIDNPGTAGSNSTTSTWQWGKPSAMKDLKTKNWGGFLEGFREKHHETTRWIECSAFLCIWPRVEDAKKELLFQLVPSSKLTQLWEMAIYSGFFPWKIVLYMGMLNYERVFTWKVHFKTIKKGMASRGPSGTEPPPKPMHRILSCSCSESAIGSVGFNGGTFLCPWQPEDVSWRCPWDLWYVWFHHLRSHASHISPGFLLIFPGRALEKRD